MADTDDDKIRSIMEIMAKFGDRTGALQKALDEITGKASGTLKSFDALRNSSYVLTDSINKLASRQRQAVTDEDKARTAIMSNRKITEDTKAAMKDLYRQLRESKITEEELQRAEDSLIRSINERQDLTEEEKQQALEAIERGNRRAKTEESLAHAGKIAAGVLGSVATAGGKVLDAYKGNDQLAIAGASLSGVAGLATDAISGVGKGAGAVGATLSTSLNPRMQGLGKALEVAGPLVDALGSGLSKVAGVALPFLQGELNKFSQAFDQASKAGAVFGDGLTGMVKASGDAGLTVSSFAKVIDQNREAISQSGLGMVDGAKLVGQVGKTLKDSNVQQGLMNLGFSLEDQAAMTADVIAQMRKTSGRMLGAQEVAPAVAEYAKNLRLLGSITGEDVAAKTKAIEKANQELALQAKLAKMDINQADFKLAMDAMTEQEQQNLRDRIIFGQVINQEGAQAESLNKAMGDKGQAIFQALQQGQLNAEKMIDINGDFGPAVKKGALALADTLGTAAVGTGDASLKALSKGQLDLINQANIFTAEAIANAKKNNKDALAGEDPATKNLMAAKVAANDMAISLQNVSIKAMPAYTKALEESTKAMKNTIDTFTSGKMDWGSIVGAVGTAIAGVVGSIASAAIGGMIMNKITGGGAGGGLLSGLLGGGGGGAGPAAGPSGGARGGPLGGLLGGGGGPAGPGGGPGGGAGGLIGNVADGMSKLGPMLASIGEGAGKAIGGIMKGIATGLEAFNKPQILGGAAILGASITLIGAGIAGAAWIMGKLLPTLAEGLQGFADIDGENLISVGQGIAALGAGLAVFGVGGALGAVGNVIGNLVEGFGKLFGGKSQVEKLKEFADLGPGLSLTGAGMLKFNEGLKAFSTMDPKAIDAVATAAARLAAITEKSTSSKVLESITSMFGSKPAEAQPTAASGTTAGNQPATNTAPAGPASAAAGIFRMVDSFPQEMVDSIKSKSTFFGPSKGTPVKIGSNPGTMSGADFAGTASALSADNAAVSKMTATTDTVVEQKAQAEEIRKATDTETMQKMLDSLDGLRKTMTEMLDISRSIADHTERTARGVQ